jgi:hypothetical protein
MYYPPAVFYHQLAESHLDLDLDDLAQVPLYKVGTPTGSMDKWRNVSMLSPYNNICCNIIKSYTCNYQFAALQMII